MCRRLRGSHASCGTNTTRTYLEAARSFEVKVSHEIHRTLVESIYSASLRMLVTALQIRAVLNDIQDKLTWRTRSG